MKYSADTVREMLEKFGSPLWVFDEKGFRENYKALDSAMKARYPKYRIAYSFKTNYTPYICKTAKSLGAWAEVVSGMEYEIARQTGYDDSHIIFNGPLKGKEGINAFLNGSLLNVDNLDELKLICDAVKAAPDREYRIGIRINLNIGQDFISRFGMDEADALEAFRYVKTVKNLKITGLHCHISRCRWLEAWKKRMEIMLELSDHFFEGPPEFLDLGSGMFGSMAPEFASQFAAVPTYEEYAEVTAGVLAEHYEGEDGPVLLTEPGTTLVNRFIDSIAEVESVKQIDSCYFAVLNTSTHILGETCTLKQLPVEVVSCGAAQKEYESIDLTGYTCLEQDIMFRGYKGKLGKGDYIIFGNTGGYSNVLKPPFIRPGCAMVADTGEGSFRLIKSAESVADVLKTYLF